MMTKGRMPKHPAYVMREDFIEPNEVTYQQIQDCTGIDGGYLKGVLKRGSYRYLSPVDAIRLARFFGKPDNHFILMQARYQAALVLRNAAKKINRVRPLTELKAAVREAKKRFILRTPSEQIVVNTDTQEPAH